MGIAVIKQEGSDPRSGKKQGLGTDVANHIENLCMARDAVDAQIKELTATKKAYDDAIKKALKCPQKSTFGPFHISWIETTSRRVDTKTLKARYPDIAEDCTVESSGDRLTITRKG